MEVKLYKFTKYDSIINEKIRIQLNDIVKEILDISKKNDIKVKSIILGGSFGRGEGSVLINGDEIVPLKDYDFAIIVKKKPSNDLIHIIKDQVYEKLKMKNPEKKNDFHLSSFLIDTWFTTENILALIKDIRIYELKEASIVLWGEDIRPKIQLKKEDIPFSSALRFLFEKSTGLIAHFSYKYLQGAHINNSEKILILYECYKTYVEICTVLCFLMDCYEPSFEKRMNLFIENFEKKIPYLSNKMPYLPSMVEKYTKFKLKPTLEFVDDDPIEIWFKTRNDLLTVLKYCLEKYTGLENIDWLNYYEECNKIMSKKYLLWMGQSLLKKIRIHNESLSSFTTSIIQLGLNWNYLFQAYKKYRFFNLDLLINTRTPILKVFLIAPLILLALKRDGSIDETYISCAKDKLTKIIKFDNGNNWDNIRRFYLKTYYLCGDIK